MGWPLPQIVQNSWEEILPFSNSLKSKPEKEEERQRTKQQQKQTSEVFDYVLKRNLFEKVAGWDLIFRNFQFRENGVIATEESFAASDKKGSVAGLRPRVWQWNESRARFWCRFPENYITRRSWWVKSLNLEWKSGRNFDTKEKYKMAAFFISAVCGQAKFCALAGLDETRLKLGSSIVFYMSCLVKTSS